MGKRSLVIIITLVFFFSLILGSVPRANAESGAFIDDQAENSNKIEGFIATIKELIEDYVVSNELPKSVAIQLTNNLEQAQHQNEIGRPEHAIKHIQDFIKHLNNEAFTGYISNNAKTVLNKDAISLIKLLENNVVIVTGVEVISDTTINVIMAQQDDLTFTLNGEVINSISEYDGTKYTITVSPLTRGIPYILAISKTGNIIYENEEIMWGPKLLSSIKGLIAGGDPNPYVSDSVITWGGKGSVAFDYKRRSVVIDLGQRQSPSEIRMINTREPSRITKDKYIFLYSNDGKTYEPIENWVLTEENIIGDTFKQIIIFSDFKVDARFLKISTTFEDTAYTVVLNPFQSSVLVYGKEIPIPPENIYKPDLAPLSPDDLKLTFEENYTSVVLTWSPSHENNIDGYIVERKIGKHNWKEVTKVLSGTSFRDTVIKQGEPVMYRVKAVGKNTQISPPSYDTGYFLDKVETLAPGAGNVHVVTQGIDSLSDRFRVEAQFDINSTNEGAFTGLVARYEGESAYLRAVYYPQISKLKIERLLDYETLILAEQNVSLIGNNHKIYLEVDGAVIMAGIDECDMLVAIDQRNTQEKINVGLISNTPATFSNIFILVLPQREFKSGDKFRYYGNYGPIGNGMVISSAFLDWDNDGFRDLLIANGRGTLERDVLVYKNVGTNENPIYDVPYGLGIPAYRMAIGDLNGDGKPDIVCSTDKIRNGLYWYENGDPTLARRLQADEKPLLTLPPDGGTIMEDLRGIQIVDWNGDGRNDILVGTGGIYWWRDAKGQNKIGDDPEAYIFYFENVSENGTTEVKLINKGRLKYGDGSDIRISGNATPFAVDWDNDNDLDLLCGQWYTYLNYFENTGSRLEPYLAEGVHITLPGSPYIAPEEDALPKPQVLDYDDDGKKDIIITSYAGLHYFLKNVGADEDPIFDKAVLIQGIGSPIDVGAFASAELVDWNNDSLLDMVVGNENGFLLYYENLGNGLYAQKKYFTTNGQRINHDAGDFQFVPVERYYGYAMPSVDDWDNDGNLDVLISDIRGRVKVYSGYGNGSLDLGEAQDILSEDGTPLKVASRTKVKMIDWNNDGLRDVVGFNLDFSLSLFKRQADGRVTEGIPLKSLGVYITCTNNIEQARNTFDVVDWNNDGKWDLLQGNMSGGYIQYYENVGSNDDPDYINRGKMMHNGEIVTDAAHFAYIHAVDYNKDGLLDLISSSDYGVIKFYDGRFLSWDID